MLRMMHTLRSCESFFNNVRKLPMLLLLITGFDFKVKTFGHTF